MASLVFDIETSALPTDSFDETTLEYLFRPAERESDPNQKQARREEIERQFALWPFTAEIVCIAMMNADTQKGQVLFVADDFEEDQDKNPDVAFRPFPDEHDLLTGFWETVQRYDCVITFNGRGFDVPFLYLRSAQLNIPITRKDWLGYRFQTHPHCDLADQLTFYNASGRDGAARRFNLDFYCKAFGIESPKGHGITGFDVSQFIAEGRYREVAEYCLRDVVATNALYHLWKDRLAHTKHGRSS
jgi:3'-5' exonuclease